MIVCDVDGCGRKARQVRVDRFITTPSPDDPETASVDGESTAMDLCDRHLNQLDAAIVKFEPPVAPSEGKRT
jgi:hypothetical protein